MVNNLFDNFRLDNLFGGNFRLDNLFDKSKAETIKKGEKCYISHNDITVGLSWEQNTYMREVGVDCSLLLLDNNGTCSSEDHVIFFNSEHIPYGIDIGIQSCEDENEFMVISLDKLPSYIKKVVFVLDIYDGLATKQDFSMLKNISITMYEWFTRRAICNFSLENGDKGSTLTVLASLERVIGGLWTFNGIGDGNIGLEHHNLKELISSFKK